MSGGSRGLVANMLYKSKIRIIHFEAALKQRCWSTKPAHYVHLYFFQAQKTILLAKIVTFETSSNYDKFYLNILKIFSL